MVGTDPCFFHPRAEVNVIYGSCQCSAVIKMASKGFVPTKKESYEHIRSRARCLAR
jgi:hypothetical protein